MCLLQCFLLWRSSWMLYWIPLCVQHRLALRFLLFQYYVVDILRVIRALYFRLWFIQIWLLLGYLTFLGRICYITLLGILLRLIKKILIYYSNFLLLIIGNSILVTHLFFLCFLQYFLLFFNALLLLLYLLLHLFEFPLFSFDLLSLSS